MRTASPRASLGFPVRLSLVAGAASLVAGCAAVIPTAAEPSASALTATAAAFPTAAAAFPTSAPFPTAAAPASATGAATASASTAATPSATASTALSGPQLAGVLLPVSSMPKGYEAGSATRNSGGELPSDSAQPLAASQVCAAFTQSAYIRAAGINTGDWAEGDYVSANQAQEVFEEIDIFTGTDAQQAMTTLWQEFGQCSSFSYESDGTNAPSKLTRTQLSGVGDGAIKAVIVSPVFDGGETLVAIRTGTQIITTLDSSSGTDLGSSALGYAEQIEQRLLAAR
jgi:hypothetical protein